MVDSEQDISTRSSLEGGPRTATISDNWSMEPGQFRD
jgi:hypothetical protein